MHGSVRNQPEHCVQCHNVNQTDAAGRPPAMAPAETITFKVMIHRLHTGSSLTTPYTIYGGSGTPTSFSKIVFPGDRRDCAKCHVNNSYQLPLPDGLANVVNPRGQVNPMGPASAACMGCHTGSEIASHVLAMTTTAGESCDVCHGKNAEFSVDSVHAR
jgi:OmcA/MtrC family decaheme c-type cytochrome